MIHGDHNVNLMHIVNLRIVQITSSFNIGGVQYYNPSFVRLPGEWILIHCNAYPRSNATLSFKPYETSDALYELPIDDGKIELVSKNVFNITRLARNDSGEYTCFFDRHRPNTTLKKIGYQVIILEEGKI